MNYPEFTAASEPEIIMASLAAVACPGDISLRPIRWDVDRALWREVPFSHGQDRIDPVYGLRSEDNPGLTIMAMHGDTIAGQISFDLTPYGKALQECEMHVWGVFVTPDERGRGIGHALGAAAIAVGEAWRRKMADMRSLSVEGSLTVTSDTEPDTGGDHVIERMHYLASDLDEAAYDEAREAGSCPAL